MGAGLDRLVSRGLETEDRATLRRDAVEDEEQLARLGLATGVRFFRDIAKVHERPSTAIGVGDLTS